MTTPAATASAAPTTAHTISDPNGNPHHARIESVHDISKIRRKGMDLSVELGFSRADATKVAVVISELARNILIYAKSGTITLIIQSNLGATKYIKIIANDKGPGIPDLNQAMTDGWTTSKGLGLGLSGSKRLVDEFSIDSQVGQGTTITAIKHLR
jgi:serine/threonine-protein kinase RsbT